MNPRLQKSITTIIKSLPAALMISGLSSCGSSGKTIEVTRTDGFQQNHGPFDSDGNYIENWADNAPKRKFIWGRSKKSSSTTSSTSSSPKPSTNIAKTSTPAKSYTPPKKTYTPPKKSSSSSSSTASKKYTPPKKKSTAKKITPKAKPPISHTVKKGDTLYGLSRKYGASVSAIQKANGLSGTSLSIGKRLIIPRK